jgi:DNA-binding GntR family transcriptional regulator
MSGAEAMMPRDSAGAVGDRRVTSPGFESTETLAEAILRHLARDIVEGRLRPGQHLVELQLCEELGASRSPVREAIHRLAAEGLVDLVPRKGAFVAELTGKEVVDVFEVRAQLERLSARLAADHANEEDVARLDAINRQCAAATQAEDFAAFFERNGAFHREIAAIAGNAYLQRVHQAAAARTFRPLFLYLSSPDHLRGSIVDHDALVEAIARRDGPRAERLMERHLRKAMEEASRLVETVPR